MTTIQFNPGYCKSTTIKYASKVYLAAHLSYIKARFTYYPNDMEYSQNALSSAIVQIRGLIKQSINNHEIVEVFDVLQKYEQDLLSALELLQAINSGLCNQHSITEATS